MVGGTTVFVPQLKINRNAAVELYYANGGKRLLTSGIGVTVYDQLDTTNLNVSGVSTLPRLFSPSFTATGVSTFTDIDLSGTADLTNVYTSGIGTFTRSFATNLNVSGVSTLASVTATGHVDVIGLTTLDDVNVSSAATITKAEVSALNVSGVTTSAGGFIGNVTGNITGTSGGLSGTPTIVVDGLTAATTS